MLTFSQSARKWEGKLREWRFNKNLPDTDMKIVVAKVEKRKVVEDKATQFFHNGVAIPNSKVENFKKRKLNRGSVGFSPSVRKLQNALILPPCVIAEIMSID